MSLLIFGSTALDSISTPKKKTLSLDEGGPKIGPGPSSTSGSQYFFLRILRTMKRIGAYELENTAPGNPNDGSVYSQFREDLFPRLNFTPPSIFFFARRIGIMLSSI